MDAVEEDIIDDTVKKIFFFLNFSTKKNNYKKDIFNSRGQIARRGRF